MSDNVSAADARHPFLVSLGERVRALRAKRGMTRKSLATQSGISERHLANLELGEGNVSVLILLQLTTPLQCGVADLLGDVTASSPEWLLIRRLLAGRDEQALALARSAMATALGVDNTGLRKGKRIALVGLRGAGKSTIGRAIAAQLGCAFVELSRQIEQIAGCSVAEIHALYGVAAYARYERQALDEVISAHEYAVIATPGAIVANTENFEIVVERCHTVWLQATPEDHMNRVLAQGDLRPIEASKRAMDDLKHILQARKAFYSRSDIAFNTSDAPLESSVQRLAELLQNRLDAVSKTK